MRSTHHHPRTELVNSGEKWSWWRFFRLLPSTTFYRKLWTPLIRMRMWVYSIWKIHTFDLAYSCSLWICPSNKTIITLIITIPRIWFSGGVIWFRDTWFTFHAIIKILKFHLISGWPFYSIHILLKWCRIQLKWICVNHSWCTNHAKRK